MAYNPSLHTATNKPLGLTGKPEGARAYYYDTLNFKYRAFVSTDEVLLYFDTAEKRKGQFPIIINTGGTLTSGVISGGVNEEWWFKNGEEDYHLTLKSIPPVIFYKSGNLLNPDALLVNKRVRVTDGVIITAADYKTMQINLHESQSKISYSGLVVSGSPNSWYAFYNGSTLVSFDDISIADGSDGEIVIPEGANIFYFTVQQASQTDSVLDDLMVNYGDALAYEAYDSTAYKVPRSSLDIEAQLDFIDDNFSFEAKKNLFEIGAEEEAKAWSNTSSTVTNNSNYAMARISVVAGNQYAISGYEGVPQGGFLTTEGATTGTNITFFDTTGGKTFIVPDGVVQVVINISATGSTDKTYVNTFQVEEGGAVTIYEAYELINTFNGYARNRSEVEAMVIFANNNFSIEPKKNLFKIGTEEENRAWSNGSSTVTTNSNYVMARIDVEEGEQYSISGYQGTPIGGFLTIKGASAGTNITMSDTTGGKTFTIPAGVVQVVIDISFSGGTDKTYVNTFQMEKSDIATTYEAYELINIFNGYALNTEESPEVAVQSGLPEPLFNGLWSKFPNFTEHFFIKDKDVTLVMQGTSLLRNNYTTSRADASTRPPLMDTNNVASDLFDKLVAFWPEQKYRRYDADSFFTETGTFSTSTGDANWDDNGYRLAHTRFSTSANAAVDFEIPIEADQFNFIYRTDSAGTTQARVTIAEGDDLLEVYNGSSWVEANAYDFSMVESSATTTKGNSTYQKRLKLRCKGTVINSIGSIKTVTINNEAGTGRFLYWGVEWSPREYMFTVINASRGSHQWNDTSIATSLIKYQDNEMYSFDPDLILFEATLINYAASTFSNIATRTPAYYTDILEEWIFNTSNAVSLSAMTGNFIDIEVVAFMDTPSVLGSGWNTDGSIKFDDNDGGDSQTVLDNFECASQYLRNKDIAFVDLYKFFKEYSDTRYGSIYNALQSSSAGGATLSIDGTHWNYNGNQLASSVLKGIFCFDEKSSAGSATKTIIPLSIAQVTDSGGDIVVSGVTLSALDGVITIAYSAGLIASHTITPDVLIWYDNKKQNGISPELDDQEAPTELIIDLGGIPTTDTRITLL